jgi:enoyl-CoA hydratase/carnithine racemase
MEYREIIFEQKGNIAIVTLNRPDVRNTVTEKEIIAEIVDACQRVQEDRSISVMILTAAGTAFSAGGNVKDMYNKVGTFAGDPDQVRDGYRQGIQRIPLAFQRLDVPTIAAVNGPAIGAGCDLTCMCDIRIASDKARFGETFASVGLIPGDGGTFLLPRIIGYSKAMELAFTCRVIDAAEALRLGLVSEVVPPDRLLARSLEIARPDSTPGQAPLQPDPGEKPGRDPGNLRLLPGPLPPFTGAHAGPGGLLCQAEGADLQVVAQPMVDTGQPAFRITS